MNRGVAFILASLNHVENQPIRMPSTSRLMPDTRANESLLLIFRTSVAPTDQEEQEAFHPLVPESVESQVAEQDLEQNSPAALQDSVATYCRSESLWWKVSPDLVRWARPAPDQEGRVEPEELLGPPGD